MRLHINDNILADLNFFPKTVATLDEHVQPKEYAIQPYMSYSGNSSTSVRVNGVGGISLATANFHDVSGNTNNLICLKLKAPPQAQHKELEAYLETPGFETGMERIQTEVREQLKISNMSITARLVNDTNNGLSVKILLTSAQISCVFSFRQLCTTKNRQVK